jgi:prepilin-type N-terminal cleavage/methylation domain-containing protein
MMIARGRGGFTLVELMVGMVLTSIVAYSMLRMVMSDMRFAEDREAWRQARQAARSGVMVVSSDLRMVDPGGGIESVSANGRDLTFRVPYAFGVLCTTNGSSTVAMLLPTDSLMLAQGGFSGFAWRDTTSGAYTYVSSGATYSATGSAATCTGAGITTVTGSTIATLGGTIPATSPAGTLLFIYRRIRYEIKASTAIPGQTGLWRTVLATGATQELAAPFDASARFNYYVNNATTAQTAVPSPLTSMTGVEMGFTGRSEFTARGTSGPKTMPFTTSIFFQNR